VLLGSFAECSRWKVVPRLLGNLLDPQYLPQLLIRACPIHLGVWCAGSQHLALVKKKILGLLSQVEMPPMREDPSVIPVMELAIPPSLKQLHQTSIDSGSASLFAEAIQGLGCRLLNQCCLPLVGSNSQELFDQ